VRGSKRSISTSVASLASEGGKDGMLKRRGGGASALEDSRRNYWRERVQQRPYHEHGRKRGICLGGERGENPSTGRKKEGGWDRMKA